MRGRMRILGAVCGILEICGTGGAKEPLVYWTGLGEAELSEHLRVLVEEGLLRLEAAEYWTTSKGRDFIDRYRTILRSIDVMGVPLDVDAV